MGTIVVTLTKVASKQPNLTLFDSLPEVLVADPASIARTLTALTDIDVKMVLVATMARIVVLTTTCTMLAPMGQELYRWNGPTMMADGCK